MTYQIKPCPICDAVPGMIVGEPILNETGKVMLEENAILSERLIRRLVLRGIKTIRVKKITQLKFFESDAAEKEIFLATHWELVQAIKGAFEKIRYLREVPVKEFKELANRCYDSLVSSVGVIQQLMTIYETDDYTFRHSVNVGVVAGVMGKWLGIKGESLKELILAGLLHDVGKTQIPLAILNKPGKLNHSEMELMKLHTAKGADLLNASCRMPDAIIGGVLQHHERMDGTGYPYRLSGNEIGLTGKVIAVADIYDAMTSNRVYQNAVTPFWVIAEFSSAMFGKLAPEICTIFVNNLTQSLIGCRVILSDCSSAKVIYINKSQMDRPTLQAPDGKYISLEERCDLSIVGIVTS